MLLDGELFTAYITDQQGTPILWPLIGPGRKEMTRSYPMNPEGKQGEPKDHPHQRSFWFTHGDINGVDFWGNLKSTVRHEKFTEMKVEKHSATLQSLNSWITPQGEKLCIDRRTFLFSESEFGRIIDFEVKITGFAEETRFGDTKEGTFGIRIASSAAVDAKKGGRILNAQGLQDEKAWGKRSEWVDYSGPVEPSGDGEIMGIAIMNHPDSFRFPTFWHVRTYGLFAANPFGEHDFESKKEKTGEFILKKDQSILFRYRVLLHRGNAESLDLNRAYSEYKNR